MFCFVGRKHIVSPRGRKRAAYADGSRTDGQKDGRETDVGRRNIGKIHSPLRGIHAKVGGMPHTRKENGKSGGTIG